MPDSCDGGPCSVGLPRFVRIGVLLFLCIAAGMVCQFALAWVLLLTSPTSKPSVLTLTAAEIAKPLDLPVQRNQDGSTSGPPVAQMDQHEGAGWYVDTEIARIFTPAGRGCWGQCAVVKCGWPMHSLRIEWARIADDGSWPDWKTPENGASGYIPLDAAPSPSGVLVPLIPKTPIWQGVVVNTAVFAAVLLACLAMVRGIRRTLRRDRAADRVRKGLCEGCGYPLNDMQTCPECGLGRNSSIPPPPPPPEAHRGSPPTGVAEP